MSKRLTKEPADKGPDVIGAGRGLAATSQRVSDVEPIRQGPGGPRAGAVLKAVGAYLVGRHGRKSRMLGVKQEVKASKTQRARAEKGLFPNDSGECSSPEWVTWPLAGGQRDGGNTVGAADMLASDGAEAIAARPPETPQAPTGANCRNVESHASQFRTFVHTTGANPEVGVKMTPT